MAWRNISICDECWERKCSRNGQEGRIPVRVVDAAKEQCGYCGLDNKSGIYVRDNTTGVPFPPKED